MWAEIGVRRRSVIQRIAQNDKLSNVNHWIETGDVQPLAPSKPPEDMPEVHIAKEQIRKDGCVIIENVTRAIEKWSQQQTLKPVELS